jgi:hypothetical protein
VPGARRPTRTRRRCSCRFHPARIPRMRVRRPPK